MKTDGGFGTARPDTRRDSFRSPPKRRRDGDHRRETPDNSLSGQPRPHHHKTQSAPSMDTAQTTVVRAVGKIQVCAFCPSGHFPTPTSWVTEAFLSVASHKCSPSHTPFSRNFFWTLLTDGNSAQVLALNTNAEHAGPFPQRGCLLLAEPSLPCAEAQRARILVVTALCCPQRTSPPLPAGRAFLAGRPSGLCCKSSRGAFSSLLTPKSCHEQLS